MNFIWTQLHRKRETICGKSDPRGRLFLLMHDVFRFSYQDMFGIVPCMKMYANDETIHSWNKIKEWEGRYFLLFKQNHMRLLLHLKRQFFALVQLALGILMTKSIAQKLEKHKKGR